MAELSAEEFAQRAFDLNLVDNRQLQELWSQLGSRRVTGDEFRQLLLRRELLTNYQVERLLRGERAGFFYGNYKVLYLVGTGTFARVYRAAHKTSGQLVAVKVLRRRFADDKEQAERFCREAEVGVTLRHPNIVPIYEIGTDAGTHFMVMEFIEGRTLREFIKAREKFEPAEATRIVTDIAAGLTYAFDRGLCHRDLKMSNILVSSRGLSKLVDFGLAAGDKNMSDDELMNSPNPRTIDYAGLERATGVRKDDQRSDIYFLGCIYYNLLTGKAPIYETKDRIQRLSKQRFLEVPPLLTVDPTLPRSVAKVVTKAMELDPSQRYQNPAEMLADLKITSRLLSEPEAIEDEESARPNQGASPAPLAALGPQRSLMFVEANTGLQDIFRERLKKNGYRVLVTRDPERAIGRFKDDVKTADCVIFSTGELGEAALEAFNLFGKNEITQPIPAILLLGENHHSWSKKAQLDDHRVVVAMPIKLKEFRDLLARLVPVEVEQ